MPCRKYLCLGQVSGSFLFGFLKKQKNVFLFFLTFAGFFIYILADRYPPLGGYVKFYRETGVSSDMENILAECYRLLGR